ncbi:bile acid:sodium symporter family protein [Dyella sp.]|jgi:sodium/bile acid cotransporter 7|uniref:bile acid:sodium symporter family protein n=1 Tax=Dyella sp. TaxID=1869338 RepID=UPI002D79E861|nr:bile acid:sodium symporter family protein [Dyella sp.]HET6431947.1 bile acid:sodium symporter family protein [Dyella sp.]
MRRIAVDPFTLALIVTLLLASLAPCRGGIAAGFDHLTDVAIALLFFLHGARLSRAAVMQGATHWRLHATVLAATFVLFPLLGWLLRPLMGAVLTTPLMLGVLYVCTLPSTVQSSIAFTSMAGGNVPAAVVSASMSSLLGTVLTPLLVGLTLAVRGGDHGFAWGAVVDIVRLLLVPFALGHALRPVIGGWADRHRALLRFSDQGTILLVVYTAFSAAVVQGLWRNTPPLALAATLGVDGLLLTLAMLATWMGAGALGFARADRITIFFCGSKKSLATGVPMAKILFATLPGGLGGIVLPLMIFHQLQLMVCAVIARRLTRRAPMADADKH